MAEETKPILCGQSFLSSQFVDPNTFETQFPAGQIYTFTDSTHLPEQYSIPRHMGPSPIQSENETVQYVQIPCYPQYHSVIQGENLYSRSLDRIPQYTPIHHFLPPQLYTTIHDASFQYPALQSTPQMTIIPTMESEIKKATSAYNKQITVQKRDLNSKGTDHKHRCEMPGCNWSFKRLEHLRRHAITHTGLYSKLIFDQISELLLI